MNGREVFKHAVKKLVSCIQFNLKKNNLKKEDIDWIIEDFLSGNGDYSGSDGG